MTPRLDGVGTRRGLFLLTFLRGGESSSDDYEVSAGVNFVDSENDWLPVPAVDV